MLKFLVTRFGATLLLCTSDSLASTEFWRSTVRVDLLEALLLAACLAVIEIPVSSFPRSDSKLRGNNRITDSCLNFVMIQGKKIEIIPLLLLHSSIRFSFSGIRAWLRNHESDCFVTALCFNMIKHFESELNNKEN